MCENCEVRIKNLETRVQAQDDELARIHEIITQYDTEVKRQRGKRVQAQVTLGQIKQDFLESRPHSKDVFSDAELVLWASYVLSNTPRRERLESLPELYRRAGIIKKLVAHFIEVVKQSGDVEEKEIENLARKRVKDYLEYILLGVPYYLKKGKKEPMTFYVAVSPWAVNNYGSKVASWQEQKALKEFNKPLEED